jgi:hypothetical protein
MFVLPNNPQTQEICYLQHMAFNTLLTCDLKSYELRFCVSSNFALLRASMIGEAAHAPFSIIPWNLSYN